jgi:hypothetical protein
VSAKAEGMIAILAALLVLFSAMIDPLVSTGVAVAALVGLGIYLITRRRK